MSEPLFIAQSGDTQLFLLPALANRHGLITGATGTGKTVTLQRMAEQLSLAGVPVFLADAKGDLSGLGTAGTASERLQKRVDQMHLGDWKPQSNPVEFWDVFGQAGHPVRATVSDMGPLLLGRLLNLNDTQAGVLQLVFRIADDNGMLLLDLKDLRAMVQHVGEHTSEYKTQYGNVSAASIGIIQRGLLTLEEQGGNQFFGEPMLDIDDLMQTIDGRGVINVLAADKLMNSPRLYALFLLWLLAELFERLPEAGDLPKPKLAFFFDEAHLLFADAPPALLEKVEQVVRLIRSKGVGVYFITQNPLDIPDTVLGQLGNRVQHALRAFTPRDQKAVKSAADTMRPNPKFSAETVITELAVGEALVSFLDEQGRPTIVERALVAPPMSRIGPMTPDERRAAMAASPLAGHYENAQDRVSAFEKLKGGAGAPAAANAPGYPPVGAGGTPSGVPSGVPAGVPPADSGGGFFDSIGDMFGSGKSSSTAPTRTRESPTEAAFKSAARAIGSQVGREIVRGVLGSILGGRRR